jgi:peptidoglycan hydrolase CwlO-like protein
MEASVAKNPSPAPKEYKSRASALKWCFERSRDRWKSKYKDLKANLKSSKNRIADLVKSREQWKLKAEQGRQQLASLAAEIAELKARIAAHEKKTDLGMPAR